MINSNKGNKILTGGVWDQKYVMKRNFYLHNRDGSRFNHET